MVPFMCLVDVPVLATFQDYMLACSAEGAGTFDPPVGEKPSVCHHPLIPLQLGDYALVRITAVAGKNLRAVPLARVSLSTAQPFVALQDTIWRQSTGGLLNSTSNTD